MKTYCYQQIDAFTKVPYEGNPAAVVFDADALEPQDMQTIARQMNLSETVFLCRPTKSGADYRARIFTPKNELPFAGHPTLAAAFGFLTTSTVDTDWRGLRLTQECAAGLITVEISALANSPVFTILAGSPRRQPVQVGRDLASRMMGCANENLADAPVEVCSVGLPWMIIPFRTLEGLKGATPDQRLIEEVCRDADATGITAYSPEAELPECHFHVRSFAPGEGIAEDPACGSGNGAAAVHIAAHLRSDHDSFSYTAEQGIEVGRKAIVQLNVENNSAGLPEVRIGGHAVTVMIGELYMPCEADSGFAAV